MPKIAPVLTSMQVNSIKSLGWHAVGGVAGLLLQIKDPEGSGSPQPRSWIFRKQVGSSRQVMGLGSYPEISLAQARELAKELSAKVVQGIDIFEERKMQRSEIIKNKSKAKTFKECAEAYLDAHLLEFSNIKHRRQWVSTLETYAYPIIGSMLVSNISISEVLDILLQPVKIKKTIGKFWYFKTNTASRLQGRIKVILDYAIVNEYRSSVNPAQWSGFLDTQLPSPKKVQPIKHQPALPYNDLPVFMQKITKNKSTSAKAIEFLILTAVRSGSVREAEWSEIDFTAKLWVIPATHTKTKQEHRVPLSNEAILLLKALPKMAGTNIIFPNNKGKPLSDMALSQLMRGMKEREELNHPAVPHGFRSTFRDWGADQTSYPDDIRKAASGHKVGDAVQQAYQRSDLLEKRRKLMNEWSRYAYEGASVRTSTVTPIRTSNGDSY